MSQITYEDLSTSFQKGLQNENWRHLNASDKALSGLRSGMRLGGKKLE
jgi:hypothetical protein